MKIKDWIVAIIALLTLSGASVYAAEKAKQPSAEEAAMMAKMQKYATPGENHKRLDYFVGDWKHTAKMWMNPKDKPTETSGSNQNKWILNGRFVEQKVKGNWMGQPFEGISLLGYDNIREEYTYVWLDNMSTGLMTATAQYDEKNKTYNESGTCACPITGEKNKKYRAVWKIIDQDHYTYEAYGAGPDGKEMKGMEIAYERVK